MSLVTAIEAEYPLLRESKHPIMVLPNSQPVQDAINLIKKGRFSASSRMNRFLSNINKISIVVKHLSSKYNLNDISDHQSSIRPTVKHNLVQFTNSSTNSRTQ